ncbi:Sulfate Permease (SulP) Family [Thraustotheca clavata]|uniref:Sulfate Permease (SulP) Family n=1 Tax=Thraustotheca clavata TaxID=74557 RepID=A0A1V9ZEF5_9STRA|nr:Sulfate Permease (SulP) Family [Thraustotheca clavata]
MVTSVSVGIRSASSRFVHDECTLPLFCESYTRNNKNTGHKNLRCFPHCCGSHRPNSFCGIAVVVEHLTRPESKEHIVSYSRFEVAPDAQIVPAIPIGARIHSSVVLADVKTPEQPLGSWMPGEKIGIGLPDDAMRFEFNGNRQCWHYGWKSNRFNCTTKHVLMVYIFESTSNGDLECIDVLSSPQFTVCSSRRSGKDAKETRDAARDAKNAREAKASLARLTLADTSAGASDDEESKNQPDDTSPTYRSRRPPSPVTYKTRRASSPPPAVPSSKRPRTEAPADLDRDHAILDAISFWDLCYTTMMSHKLSSPPVVLKVARSDSIFYDAFSSILRALVEPEVVTWVQNHFRSPPMLDYMGSFHHLLYYLSVKINDVLSRQHYTSLTQWLQLVQFDTQWRPETTISTWLPNYISYVDNMQNALWVSTNALTSDKFLMGTWERDSTIKHTNLLMETALDRSSKHWTCQWIDDNTIQVRWDDALCGAWMVLDLEHDNSAKPQTQTQLLAPGGLSTIGTEWTLCGTRAWRENQDDTLVIEWYFWPKKLGMPRRRVRERFTLLASSTNRLMCQLFVELSDSVPSTDPGDMIQRILLPANWQVQQIQSQYYQQKFFMSFADFAVTPVGPRGPVSLGAHKQQSHPVMDKVSAKLEQFQRQVTEVKRQAASISTAIDVQQGLEDRIKYACLLQEEIKKLMPDLPRTSAMEVSRRKLLKDYDTISNQLEKVVLQVSNAQQQHVQMLNEQAEMNHGGIVRGSVNGQVIEFKKLDNEIAHNEALIEERARDINRIQQSVVQVNEIFRDLAVIVGEQQGAIDDAHGHIEESLAQTQQGLAETLLFFFMTTERDVFTRLHVSPRKANTQRVERSYSLSVINFSPTKQISPPPSARISLVGDPKDPHTLLQGVYQYFSNATGRTSPRKTIGATSMDGTGFARFCRACPHLVGKRFGLGDIDLTFAKVRPRSERRITYAGFVEALGIIALKKYPDLNLELAVRKLLDVHISSLPSLEYVPNSKKKSTSHEDTPLLTQELLECSETIDKIYASIKQLERQVVHLQKQSKAPIAPTDEFELPDRIKFAYMLDDELQQLIGTLPKSLPSRPAIMKSFDKVNQELESAVTATTQAQIQWRNHPSPPPPPMKSPRSQSSVGCLAEYIAERVKTLETSPKKTAPVVARVHLSVASDVHHLPTVTLEGDPKDPHTLLRGVFQYYCRFGRTGGADNTMDGTNFAKFCRECPSLLGLKFVPVDIDLTFAKFKPKGARRISYALFLEALGMIALKRYPDLDLEHALPRLIKMNIAKLPCIEPTDATAVWQRRHVPSQRTQEVPNTQQETETNNNLVEAEILPPPAPIEQRKASLSDPEIAL